MAEKTLPVLSSHDFPQLVPSAAEAEAALDRIRQARLADAEINTSHPEPELPYYTLGSEAIADYLASREADRG